MAAEKFTKSAVRQAIKGSGGVKLRVCEALGCVRQTLENYLKKWPELIDDLKNEREVMVDEAENAIRDLVADRHPESVRFVLSTQGKDRGWTTRTEITGANGAALFDLSPSAQEAMRLLGVTLEDVREQFEAMILAAAAGLAASPSPRVSGGLMEAPMGAADGQ